MAAPKVDLLVVGSGEGEVLATGAVAGRDDGADEALGLKSLFKKPPVD